jgi:hypothetical protein
MRYEFEFEKQVILIPIILLDVLFKFDNPSDIIALYILYYCVAKEQSTDEFKATIPFCSKKLMISERRVREAKKFLELNSMIGEYKKIDNKTGQVKDWVLRFTSPLLTWSPPLQIREGGELSSYHADKLEKNALFDSEYPSKNPSLQIRKSGVYIINDIYIKDTINKIYISYKDKICNKSRLLNDGIKKIETRLKTYTCDELIMAIDNFSKNKWFMDNNSGRGISWFFKSDSQIDKWLSLKEIKEKKPAQVITISKYNG